MLEETIGYLKQLKLNGIVDILGKKLDEFNDTKKSALEFLKDLLKIEITYREQKSTNNNVHVSHFPFLKELKDFDFDFQTCINKQKIIDLSNLRFMEEHKNIIFIGNSGVGKTHLATSIGIEAAKHHYSTYFISCNDLINNLLTAYKENKSDERIKHYNKYKLLIIDEVGYLPIDKNGVNLLFQLIAKRYEVKSTILTTNQDFSKWPELFGDALVANAMLDRLVHHAEIINITGNSYRMKDLKEKMKTNSNWEENKNEI